MTKQEEILKRHTEKAAGCQVEYNITHDAIISAMTEYSNLLQADNMETIQALEAESEKWKLDAAEQYRQKILSDEKCERYKKVADNYYEESIIYRETNSQLQSRIAELEAEREERNNYYENKIETIQRILNGGFEELSKTEKQVIELKTQNDALIKSDIDQIELIHELTNQNKNFRDKLSETQKICGNSNSTGVLCDIWSNIELLWHD